MPRIQVLELPSVVVGDLVETPFALIIDQAEVAFEGPGHPLLAKFMEKIGAKAIGVFSETIDIPANL